MKKIALLFVMLAASTVNAQQKCRIVKCLPDLPCQVVEEVPAEGIKCVNIEYEQPVPPVLVPPPAPLPPLPPPKPVCPACPTCGVCPVPPPAPAPPAPVPQLKLRHQYDFRPVFQAEAGVISVAGVGYYGAAGFGFRFQRPESKFGFELLGFAGAIQWHGALMPAFGARLTGVASLGRVEFGLGLGYFGAQPVERTNESDINSVLVSPEVRVKVLSGLSLFGAADLGVGLTHVKVAVPADSSAKDCYRHQAAFASGGRIGLRYVW
jgi:hypothetical protein